MFFGNVTKKSSFGKWQIASKVFGFGIYVFL